MGTVANEANSTVTEGERMVSDLNAKSETTANLIKILVEDIAQVQERFNSIRSIMETINCIAWQTSLWKTENR
jgi:methyl-accepting chemotaxis protein